VCVYMVEGSYINEEFIMKMGRVVRECVFDGYVLLPAFSCCFQRSQDRVCYHTKFIQQSKWVQWLLVKPSAQALDSFAYFAYLPN